MTNEYTKLFKEIASSLNITRGSDESSTNWMERITYSAAGRTALYSLYDHLEDEESVSITHFKNRARREISALCAAGNMTFITDDICREICDEIYDEYLNTGYLYHSQYRIEPVPYKISHGKFIDFIRGATFDKKTKASGLGCYFMKTNEDEESSSDSSFSEIFEMFHINHMKLDDYYRKLIERSSWQLFNAFDNIEYLRITGPFSRGYWSQQPNKDGDISLLRIGQQGGKIYYLYKYENNNSYVSVLPDWMTNNNEYRQIANCLLFHRGTLPESVIHTDKNIVELNIGYLYPPSIQNVIMLYSWPKNLNNVKTAFNRVMNLQVWESIRAVIEPLGYKFKEESS
jgi:hypothetical protein